MQHAGHQIHLMELLSVNVKLDSLEMEHYAEVNDVLQFILSSKYSSLTKHTVYAIFNIIT